VLVRELDTAIWLWFFGYDSVSIHLLVSSAHRCLDDIGKKAGIRPKIKELLADQDLEQAYDFFRHASSDLRIHLDFAPALNQWLLWDSINAFAKIFHRRTAYMKCLAAFTSLQLASDSASLEQAQELFLPDGVQIENVRKLDPVEFFDKMLPLFAGSA
jgi:hypothetical protein